MTAFSTAGPHRSKERIPPGPAARDAAAALRDDLPDPVVAAVIDLSAYAPAAARRRTLLRLPILLQTNTTDDDHHNDQ